MLIFGTYTIIRSDGKYLTIRVRAWGETKPGFAVAEYLYGSNNEADYRGFATIDIPNNRFFLWKDYRGNANFDFAMRALLSDPMTAGKAYSMRSGKCFACGRKLTTPQSIEAGIGPECAKRVG